MKKYFYLILFTIAYCGLNAQCTNCTTSITNNLQAPLIISSGQAYCIAPGVIVSGRILITGGSLCNQGTITSSNIAVTGGGSFTNYSTLNVDSLLVTGAGSQYTNNGFTVHIRISCTNGGAITNNDSISCNHFGDSLGVFTNMGYVLAADTFSVGYNGTVVNNAYINVSGDFFNGFNATTTNNCQFIVGNNWYNSATIEGPTNGTCGQFKVGGTAYNSGSVAPAGKVDICITGNGAYLSNGTNGSGFTQCTCTPACLATGVNHVEANNLNASIYPNPANDVVNIETETPATYQFTLFDITGKAIQQKTANGSLLQLNVKGIAPGTYLLQIKNTVTLNTGRFNVVVQK